MGKLLKLLEQAATAAGPGPLGFRASASPGAPLSIALIGLISSSQGTAQAQKIPLNALLFHSDSQEADNLRGLSKAPGSTPWGLWLSKPTSESAEEIKTLGCDFVLLPYDDFPIEALKGDDIDRVLTLPLNIEEARARAVDALPIDAILLSGDVKAPLTLHTLMSIVSIRSLIDKPFLLPVDSILSSWEMECLRETGIDGLVLDMTKMELKSVETLLKNLKGLPKPKPRDGKHPAMLPRLGPGPQAHPGHEEEEEEEEDD